MAHNRVISYESYLICVGQNLNDANLGPAVLMHNTNPKSPMLIQMVAEENIAPVKSCTDNSNHQYCLSVNLFPLAFIKLLGNGT